MKDFKETDFALSVAVCAVLGFVLFATYKHWDKERESSRAKATIGNMRQIASAADQYFIEENVKIIYSIDDLVGTDKYIKSISSINGENYRDLFPIKSGFTELNITNRDGKTITFQQ